MNDWLEKAEENQKIKENILFQGTDNEIETIQSNVQLLETLTQKLSFLVDRAAKISVEFRKPSIELGFTHLQGDPVYEFYGSAYTQFDKKIFFYKLSSELYLCWRRIYFKIPAQPNRVKIVIHEKCSSEVTKKKTHSTREKFKFKITDLNEDLSQTILDWLVFKIKTEDLKKSLPITHFHN
ncbi:MAG: hypothetical protein A2033_14060 [Bacteroidetes bacterium GWA2_31_9]|nr:MAG: hypothetical protein A2033_14060 [Bacteroidetes bacterium GWA2_31_9]